MKLTDFLSRHGLNADPFATFNAEEESLLATYFVRPPYFASVLGNPAQPKSSIVFAPRGGGKTAQRRVLEEDSQAPDSKYLCVLYDQFPPVTSTAELQRLTVDDHLERVCVRVLMAILMEIEASSAAANKLQKTDKDFIAAQCARLENITREELETVIKSLKSQARLTGDWLRDHSGPVKIIVSTLLKKRGIDLGPMPVGRRRASPERIPGKR